MMLIPSEDTIVAIVICFFQCFFIASTIPSMASLITILAPASTS